MREWASEQRPTVRERVLLMCDALEECGLAVLDAQRRVADLKLRVEEFQHELDHLVDGGR
jgi:hypothetical protein